MPPVACGAADAVAELDEMPVRFGGDKARVAEPAPCVFQNALEDRDPAPSRDMAAPDYGL